MKKILSFMALIGLLAGFASCTKNQTELSGDTLSTTVVVSGHVRYIAVDKSGKTEDPEPVDSGTPVNVYYGVPGEGGKVTYALKTLKANDEGFFETRIGCPPGQTLDVKVQSFMSGSSYTTDSSSKLTESDAYFFAEVRKTVACGSAAYFQVDLRPVSHISEPGLKQ